MRDKILAIADQNNGVISADNCKYRDFIIIADGEVIERVVSIDMKTNTITFYDASDDGRVIVNGDELSMDTMKFNFIDFRGVADAR